MLIAGQIERDKRIADRLEPLDDDLALAQHDIEIGRINFQPRDLAVMAHAHLPQPQPVQDHLGLFHLRQQFNGNRRAVRNTRRQTRRRRFVPVGQAQVHAPDRARPAW